MSADPTVRTFDPKQIVGTFGPIIFSGFAAGTFLKITRNGQIFEKVKGADGTVSRVNKNATDYSVSLTLMQTSLTNDLLSAAAIADQLSNTGKAPLLIKDLNGNTLFFAPQAWIAKDPDDEESDSISNREWVFDTGPAAKVTGGNIL